MKDIISSISAEPLHAHQIRKCLELLDTPWLRIDRPSEYSAKLASKARFLYLSDPATSQIISLLAYYDNQPTLFITLLWVHPEWRGNGFARFLLEQIISTTSKTIALETSIDNPAIKLYLDKGFRICGHKNGIAVLTRSPMLAIMQPYFLPSPSYFQLVNTVDKFIFYDDVCFRKKSWINRNYILLDGQKHLFSIPLHKASQNRLINEVGLAWTSQWKRSFLATIKHCYASAPFYKVCFGLISDLLSENNISIADLAITSIESVANYLGFTTIFGRSSDLSPSSRSKRREQRLIAITKQLCYSAYANTAGGKELYSIDQFKPYKIDLLFVESRLPRYNQFHPQFTPGLSILDLLMFNSPQQCKFLLSNYTVQ